MCGIYGFTTKLNNLKKKSILSDIGFQLKHRGPDQSGSFIDDDIALGIERLSIMDLQNGNQPIFSNNRQYVIVHNGEIYNYKEIRKNLQKKGFSFSTDTDTEVIVNLYQLKGIRCLNELNGMFAFAIYDIEKKKTVIARDRYGIKPLYYFNQNSNFVFSSELKGLKAHPDVSTTISNKAIDLYLTMEYVPTPLSIYEEINKLEQGHYLSIEKNRIQKEKWYEYTFQPNIILKNKNDYIEKLDYLISKSVNLRMRSDVPIGTFLSGGLDSSLITCYLSKLLPKRLKTFHIGFENTSFDETNYSKEISTFLETDHYSRIFTSNDLSNLLPNIWSNMDEPFSDASLLPTYLLSQYTKGEVTVALSGDGGDEVFGGYPTYLAHKVANRIPKVFNLFLEYLANKFPVSFNNLSLDFKLKQFTRSLKYAPIHRHQYWLGSFDKKNKNDGFNEDFINQLGSKNNLNYLFTDLNKTFKVNKNWEFHLFQDMKYYLHDDMLVKVDRASMANSLEVRIPFLDHNIVEYMASVPSNMKYRNITSKYLLKLLGRKYLPKHIVNRPKKGFGIPIAEWFNTILKDQLTDIIKNKNSYIHNIFKPSYTNKIMQNHFDKKNDNRKLLWTLFVLENWNQNRTN